MNATLISKEKTAVKLSFEVSAEVLEQGMAFAYNKHKNNLSLPGFRKGKVPRKLIEAQYGEGFFYEDAINHIFPDEYIELDKIRRASQAELDGKLAELKVLAAQTGQLMKAGKKEEAEAVKIDGHCVLVLVNTIKIKADKCLGIPEAGTPDVNR